MKIIKAFMVVGVVVGLSFAVVERASAQPPAVKKEDLRYDGKTFEDWKDGWHAELKAERRIDVIRAMAMFGSRGHAEEAAAIIMEIVQEYDVFGFSWTKEAIKWSADDLVVREAMMALSKIGPDGSPSVMAKLGDAKTAWIVDLMRDGWRPGFPGYPITAAAVPAIVKHLQGDEASREVGLTNTRSTRMVALSLLATDGLNVKEVRTAFLTAMDKKEDAQGVSAVLVEALDHYEHLFTLQHRFGRDLLMLLGPKASAAVPAIINKLTQLKAETDKEKDGWDDTYTRPMGRSCIRVLAEIGPAARDALPILEAFVQESGPGLRDDALKAIEKIRGPSEKAKKTNR